jgi:hypothetical protein
VVQPRLHVEGLDQFRRQLRQVSPDGRQYQKELGQVHKAIGELVIGKVGGRSTGVGSGRGETIRPSAAAREVMLLVGGSHRSQKREQWGVYQRWPGGEPPERPHLIGAAYAARREIEDRYIDAIDALARRAGLK